MFAPKYRNLSIIVYLLICHNLLKYFNIEHMVCFLNFGLLVFVVADSGGRLNFVLIGCSKMSLPQNVLCIHTTYVAQFPFTNISMVSLYYAILLSQSTNFKEYHRELIKYL